MIFDQKKRYNFAKSTELNSRGIPEVIVWDSNIAPIFSRYTNSRCDVVCKSRRFTEGHASPVGVQRKRIAGILRALRPVSRKSRKLSGPKRHL